MSSQSSWRSCAYCPVIVRVVQSMRLPTLTILVELCLRNTVIIEKYPQVINFFLSVFNTRAGDAVSQPQTGMARQHGSFAVSVYHFAVIYFTIITASGLQHLFIKKKSEL